MMEALKEFIPPCRLRIGTHESQLPHEAVTLFKCPAIETTTTPQGMAALDAVTSRIRGQGVLSRQATLYVYTIDQEECESAFGAETCPHAANLETRQQIKPLVVADTSDGEIGELVGMSNVPQDYHPDVTAWLIKHRDNRFG